MTPGQFENAAEECIKAMEELALFMKQDNRSKEALGHLKEIVALAKSAIPSGQVAEGRRLIALAIQPWTEGEHKERLLAALNGLAAQAQSAEVWRKRLEAAADALADVLPGEVGRLDLLARIVELKRQRDEYRKQMLRDGGKFLKEMARADQLEEAINGAGGWRDVLAVESALLKDEREKVARLSAAGQVLSEHVDKEQCPCLTDSPMGAERLCPEHDAPEWTIRDEFAKAQDEIVETMERIVEDGKSRGAAKWASGGMDGHANCPDNPCPGYHPYCEGVGKDADPARAWTMRDEFAKAAMQALITRAGDILERPGIARAAYMMADTMLAKRPDAVDIAPEQEKEWETEVRKDAAEQMNAACLAAVQTYLDGIGLEHDVPMWRDIEHAIQKAKP